MSREQYPAQPQPRLQPGTMATSTQVAERPSVSKLLSIDVVSAIGSACAVAPFVTMIDQGSCRLRLWRPSGLRCDRRVFVFCRAVRAVPCGPCRCERTCDDSCHVSVERNGVDAAG